MTFFRSECHFVKSGNLQIDKQILANIVKLCCEYLRIDKEIPANIVKVRCEYLRIDKEIHANILELRCEQLRIHKQILSNMRNLYCEYHGVDAASADDGGRMGTRGDAANTAETSANTRLGSGVGQGRAAESGYYWKSNDFQLKSLRNSDLECRDGWASGPAGDQANSPRRLPQARRDFRKHGFRLKTGIPGAGVPGAGVPEVPGAGVPGGGIPGVPGAGVPGPTITYH